MEKNGKIATFSLAFHPKIGGAEIAIEEIAKHLPNRNFVVFTMRFDGEHLRNEAIGNIEIVRLCPIWIPLTLRKILYPFVAVREANKRSSEFCVVWGMMAAHAGLAASWFKRSNPKIRFLLSLQEGKTENEIDKETRWIRPIFESIFKRADTIQCISEFLAVIAKKYSKNKKIEVVPNGVDLRKFSKRDDVVRKTVRDNFNLSEDDFVVVTTSRLVYKNGIDTLIESVSLLEGIHLVIFGDGPDRENLEKLVSERNVRDRVIFAGEIPQEEIPKMLAAADCFVRLSRAEGFGISFIEAMALGAPVIATGVGGILEFAHNNENSIIVEPNNPQVAAEAINRIKNDSDLRKKLIENAFETVKRYDWGVLAKKMEEILFYSD